MPPMSRVVLSHSPRAQSLSRDCLVSTALMLVIVGLASGLAKGATILVTTTQQRVSGGAGCSLQEAIYASNYQASVSIAGLNPDNTNHFVTTNCVPGDGNDTIVLPTKAVFYMNQIVDDAINPFGPTATPIIFSHITIEANGSQVIWTGTQNARAFAIFTIQPSSLTIKNAYIKGFVAQGGKGGSAGPQAGTGGGGMGAGGAIYAYSNGFGFGAVTVENSTFEGNAALGGSGGGQGPGAGYGGGGGGGLGGSGGGFVFTSGYGPVAGGGGGGSRGSGHVARFIFFIEGPYGDGGGGGGTVLNSDGRLGGYNCGGAGGQAGSPDVSTGQDALCVGGGGGGAGSCVACGPVLGNNGGTGGAGTYGGGGGGGGFSDGNGGAGGFGGGGGGGAGQVFGTPAGGNGGFGGGGGGAVAGKPGKGGTFGGDSNNGFGGGGAGLGGAIFSDGATVVVRNSTFTGNRVFRGEQGGPLSDNGQDAGGAIFMLNGSLTVENSTIAGNSATGSGSGITVYQKDDTPTSFTLLNTIITGNGGLNECSIQAGGTVTSAGFAGNLIYGDDPLNPCPGVVSNANLALRPLQDNGGYTPTMAIIAGSAAWGTADPASSLATDQRDHQRPSEDGHGFDIGAFELCTPSHPAISPFPCTTPTITQGATLTMQASPFNGGTTDPAVGQHGEPSDAIIPIAATPNPNNTFAGWSANVTDPTNPSTTVVMNQDQTVTASFAPLAPCGNTLTGRGTASSTYNPARVGLVWTEITGLDHWDILRGTALAGPYAKIASVPATTSSYSDSKGLLDGQAYDYTLNAIDAHGNLMCWSNQKAIFVP